MRLARLAALTSDFFATLHAAFGTLDTIVWNAWAVGLLLLFCRVSKNAISRIAGGPRGVSGPDQANKP
jgi:hypothetical protein